MKEIPLSKGYVAIVDDDDYERVAQFKWCVQVVHRHDRREPSIQAIRRSEGGRKNSKIILMHRFILNAPAELVVDHINWNRLDNRKENLRLCTHAQNRAHSRRPNRISGAIGVHQTVWNNNQKWRAVFRQRHIGVFDTREEAARAYDKVAIEEFGEFAVLNFPHEHSSVALTTKQNVKIGD